MSRIISRAETFENVVNAFSQINFSAFDFNTVKQSLIDYLQIYFPENFNDLIESSELIAIIETFAYIAEQMAYRIDMNANENFISTAQRKDSILRLAKLISYKSSRNMPARGLVKITSVSTTESVIDTNNTELANTVIKWNDVTNPNWKEQFIAVIQRVLEQEFGTVTPSERFQIQDVLFEIYGIQPIQLTSPVIKYSAVVNGKSLPMELVSAEQNEFSGISERRPSNNSNFTIMFTSDGLGDSSPDTGFQILTKQGTLRRFRTEFDGITPNQTFDIDTTNINELDVWINNVNSETGETIDDITNSARLSSTLKSGEWVEVDLAHAQNVIFNTNPERNKFEIETLDNDRVRIIFGDGGFANIPNGTFDIWVRESENENITIPQLSVVDQTATFNYLDNDGNIQTFTFTFSLNNALQNNSASETIEHTRITAPSIYFTQNRMVNAEDYNIFMLQDPTIKKLRAVNRTFAGDSKFIPWHDASESYENVKIFSDDGILYINDKNVSVTTGEVTFDVLITNFIEPLLSTPDIYNQLITHGVPNNQIRRLFTTPEKDDIVANLTPPPAPSEIKMYYNLVTNTWDTIHSIDDPNVELPNYPNDYIKDPLIQVKQLNILENKYSVTRFSRRILCYSQTTKFWNTNDSDRVIEFDTLDSVLDEIIILKANTNNNKDAILQQNWTFNVLGQEINDFGDETGLRNIHNISLLPADENGDGIPDGMDIGALDKTGLADIITPKIFLDTTSLTFPLVYELPINYIVGKGDVDIIHIDGATAPVWSEDTSDTVSNKITITSIDPGTTQLLIVVNEYVYFTRETDDTEFLPVETTDENIRKFLLDEIAGTNLWRRNIGTNNLNFAWLHRTTQRVLVDPSPTNIIDTFIITQGFYNDTLRWVNEDNFPQPLPPTPFELRSSFGELLDNKMISDTVILHPGIIKIIFGSKASPELQAKIKVIRHPNGVLTNNQIKTRIVNLVRAFFDIELWNFGEKFYFSELAAVIHNELATEISSVVLVPLLENHQFGDLIEIFVREDEILFPHITVNDIEVVETFTSLNLKLEPES